MHDLYIYDIDSFEGLDTSTLSKWERSISEIGVVTALDEVKKVVSNMNLRYYASKITDDNVEIKAYRQTLPNIFASENVVKMILLKQECPEE